jgi:glycosyltransferase involved in cell wall biosynthesis
VRIRFLTSTPLDIRRGSGTYVGMHVLARALERLGHSVDFETPARALPVYTLQRWLFNRSLRATDHDITVGFDLDGYRLPGNVAALKGVIADEALYERGLTRRTMGMQAEWEREHVQGASRVLTTSRYAAERARELYGLAELPAIVPELIDLAEWRALLAAHPAKSSAFTVLNVGRHYRRKRIDVLLRAAARLRIPFELRIVGSGPCTADWRALAERLGVAAVWLGDVSRAELAAEYNRADVFCLPSVQEGFGIVLLEAMAAGNPIVAARAAAIPEVAVHGVLVEPESAEALAAGIERVYTERGLGVAAGLAWVEQFDAERVAEKFIDAIHRGAAENAEKARRKTATAI